MAGSLFDGMDIGQYHRLVGKAEATYSDWRMGQAYFNVLADVRPDLSEQVRGTDLDPFYRNERVSAFLGFISERW